MVAEKEGTLKDFIGESIVLGEGCAIDISKDLIIVESWGAYFVIELEGDKIKKMRIVRKR